MDVIIRMRPIPDASYFKLIQQAYRKAKCKSQDPHDQPLFNDDDGSFPKKKKYGPYVQFEIRRSSISGMTKGTAADRGIFATEFVAQGQPVWGCELYGIFRYETEWNIFLKALPSSDPSTGSNSNVLEDMAMWSYVMNWGDGTFVVGIDLDEASLMNHGGTSVVHNQFQYGSRRSRSSSSSSSSSSDENGTDDPSLSANITCEYRDGQWKYYATRDIHPNEEILCDYNQFHVADHPLDWYTASIQTILDTGS
jgi:hypothetical protein